MASSDGGSSAPKEIPGSYGLPMVGAVRDRLDFYYFQGQDKYFESRVERYGSTVVRINVPPGPFMARDPRVVAVLDAKSFPVLFDMDKVEKKDLFAGGGRYGGGALSLAAGERGGREDTRRSALRINTRAG